MEDSLENLDLSFRGDEGSRRKAEIKLKMWKKYPGGGRDWMRKSSGNRIKLVMWSLVPRLFPISQVWLGHQDSNLWRGSYFDPEVEKSAVYVSMHKP